MSTQLQLIGLEAQLGAFRLGPLHLDLAPGERFVLLGQSGSGKSTFLRCLAGLQPSHGVIRWGDQEFQNLPPEVRGISWLPQRVVMYPGLSVLEQLKLLGDAARIARIAQQTRIDHLLTRRPHELSGGERQRVGWARLMMQNRPIWLLDEPFSSLDLTIQDEFRHDLHLLHVETSATILIVTHNPRDALALGHRVGVLELGQLVQVGTTTELLEHPSHLATAYCLGQVSVLTGDVSDGDPHETAIAFSTKTMFVSECGSIRLPLPGTVFREIVGKSAPLLALGLRPDAARPANSPPTLRERVITGWNLLSAEPVGRRWLLQLIRGRSRVCMEWNSGSPPPPGASCPWILATDKLLWFNRATGERIRETTGASGD